MKKAKKSPKRLDLTKPVERPRMPFMVMLRMFLLGSVAVVAAVLAIYRHYAVPRPSMLMPVPSASVRDEEPLPPGLVPVPEFVPLGTSSSSASPSPRQ